MNYILITKILIQYIKILVVREHNLAHNTDRNPIIRINYFVVTINGQTLAI